MKKIIKYIPSFLLLVTVLIPTQVAAQCSVNSVSPSSLTFSQSGGTKTMTINYSGSNCFDSMSFTGVPSWITSISQTNQNTITVVCSTSTTNRSTLITYHYNGTPGGISINQTGTPRTWYHDFDGDGYGDPNDTKVQVTQPSGYISDNRDCNDASASVHPFAPEICDGLDNDCDGTVDEIVQPDPPPVPTVTNNCGNTQLTRSNPPSGVVYYWQDSFQGTDMGNSDTSVLRSPSSGNEYYIKAYRVASQCWSTTTLVQYSINTSPTMPPVVTIDKNCGNTVLTRGNPPSGITWYWQSTSTGENTLDSSTSVTKYNDGTYFLRGRNNTSGCWGASRQVNYTVDPQPPVPNTPVITYSCGYTTLTKGVSPNSSITWFWQDSPSGTGTGNDNAVDSKTFNSPGTYYLRAKSQDVDCWSDPVQIDYIVNGVPGVASGVDVSRCGEGTVTLSATPGVNANTIRWYNEGGILLATGTNFTTPSHHETTTYYAESYNPSSSCGTASRAVIRAVINPIPSSAIIGGNVERCGPGSMTLAVTPGANGDIIRWYNASETLLATGNSFTTPNLSVTTTYYVETYNTTTQCYATAKTPVEVKINPNITWYLDADNDNLGDPNSSTQSCTQPQGYVENNNDQCPDITSTTNDCTVTGGDPSDYNYLYTRIYQEERTTPVNFFTQDDGTQQQLTYFDGLGRPMQEIGIDHSPTKDDIVTHIAYDNYGRVEKEFLPYVTSQGNIGDFHIDALSKTHAYYNTAKYENTFNPYSQKQFESSPLSRVLKQAAPGADWAIGSNHEIDFDYLTNLNADTVKQFNVTLNFTDGIFVPTLIVRTDNNGYYNEKELYKSIVKDENHTNGKNHTTEEFTNKQGKVILKRTYANLDLNNDGDVLDSGETEVPHNTYYVYDDYGNLTYVLPSKVTTDDGVSSSELAELCYQYIYDHRNRLVKKKIPGKGWEYIVYNSLDQPVHVQDANLRKENSGKPWDQWLFTKYDATGRIIYSGSVVNSSTRKIIQYRASSSNYAYYESKNSALINIGGTNLYYSNNAYPTSIHKIYTVNYYDDYAFDTASLILPATTSFGQQIINNDNSNPVKTKGLVTGTKVRVLETNDWITTLTGYDQKGRVIYLITKNEYLETVDIIENHLDFAGKVLHTKTTHSKGNNSPIVTLDNFVYDHIGRLLVQTQIINNQTPETIVANTFDALGQLESKLIGAGLQKVDYTYNIRGWLRSINNGTTANGDLFGFKINYNDPQFGATPLYNGNIAETQWETANDNVQRWYKYSYDALNRITDGVNKDGHYGLSDVSYDKNGNIQTLNRIGYIAPSASGGSGQFTFIDWLGYEYDLGNKLLKVTDSARKDTGFIDVDNTTNDYTYDANGNMISDQNKGITGISYNHLNLPQTVTINTTEHNGNINYIYDATGAKLKKIVTEGSSLTNTTEYAGNYIYKNDVLEFFNHTEGIVEPEADGYKYVYQFKDHLGNIRLSYKDFNKDGAISIDEIVQEKNYYPFGLQHQYGGNDPRSAINGRNHNYGFGGKEEQNDMDLGWIDITARNYDPTIGRWMNLDPLADKYRDMSPYNYTANNPILYKDPDGREIIISDNTKDALTKLAQIAATRSGRIRLDALIGSTHQYTMKSIFFTQNNLYDGPGKEGKARTIYYASSSWRFSSGGGAPGSMYLTGHEIDHAYNHQKQWYSATTKDLERSAVGFGNYLRSVYGEKDMRTSYFGAGRFSDNPKSYNSFNEKVTKFKETLSVETEKGATILGFSYETSTGDEESTTEYMLSVSKKDGTYAYRIFRDKKEYDKAVKRVNELKKKQKEDEN